MHFGRRRFLQGLGALIGAALLPVSVAFSSRPNAPCVQKGKSLLSWVGPWKLAAPGEAAKLIEEGDIVKLLAERKHQFLLEYAAAVEDAFWSGITLEDGSLPRGNAIGVEYWVRKDSAAKPTMEVDWVR